MGVDKPSGKSSDYNPYDEPIGGKSTQSEKGASAAEWHSVWDGLLKMLGGAVAISAAVMLYQAIQRGPGQLTDDASGKSYARQEFVFPGGGKVDYWFEVNPDGSKTAYQRVKELHIRKLETTPGMTSGEKSAYIVDILNTADAKDGVLDLRVDNSSIDKIVAPDAKKN